MNMREQNKWKMYQAVHSVCLQHEPEWNGLQAFAVRFDAFTAQVGAIEALEHQQAQSLLGKSDAVEQQKEEIVPIARKIAMGLRVYARHTGNAGLQAAMKIPLWKMKLVRQVTLIEYLDRILQAAQAHAAQLGEFGVSQQLIDSLQAERILLGDMLGTPRIAIIDRKQATSELKTLISGIMTLLSKEMDPLVEVLKDDYPKFCQRYQNARAIVDLKGKKNKKNPGGEATDPDGSPDSPDSPR